MLLLHERRVGFIHVPKTGGRSISQALTGRSDICPEHDTAEDAKAAIPDWPDWFSFAFVRNPWDRWLSLWSWHRLRYRGGGSPLLPFIANQLGKWPMEPDQTAFILSRDGQRLVSFVGRFERLQEDYDAACDIADLPVTRLPHLNQTTHRHYRDHYCDKAAELVAQHSARDIERFGYQF